MKQHAILCSVCRAPATRRMSTFHKHFYKCSRGHETTMLRTAADQRDGVKALPGARRTDPETSHLAAASMVGKIEAQQERILSRLQVFGPMTADQVDELIGWRETTAGRRLPELAEMGSVRRLETTGITRSGRQARLWEMIR